MTFVKRRIMFLTAVTTAGLLFSGLAFSFILFGPRPVALAVTNFSLGANQDVKARLDGFQQVPSILTDGKGTFKAKINENAETISYTLTYSGLSSPATMAHIHFGQQGVNGGVFAFLCGGGGKPACPTSGTVTGTITAADILAIASQGLAARDFAGAVRAILSGNTYVNVHTTNFPAGEIRGQITANSSDQNNQNN